MSELKRAPISTISDGDREKKSTHSVRLELKLFEPNAVEFPEFNYQTLLHGEKKKRKKMSKINNGFATGGDPGDPFENDDDVARIAKELEKKYGTNSSYTKKRSGRVPGDICDKGAGYDENDSFIDNTEAYDELIPDEIETVRGGFYINSGPLEFQHLSNYERPEDAQRMPKPKKRVLSTSSSSSDEERGSAAKAATGEGAKNGHHGPPHQEKKIKTSSNAPSSDGKTQKSTKVPSEKRNDVKVSSTKTEQQQQQQDVGKERLLKTTTVKDMLRAKRDNLRNMQQEAAADGVDLSSAPITSESSNECTAIEMASNGGAAVPAAEPKLPTNLSEDLLKNIAHLKEAAKVCTSLGKSNFFDTKVQEVLLKVENATRLAGGHVRNQVYSYLEVHLPCSKQTLMLRAKKMRIQQEEARVERAVVKLRRGIDEAMPGVMEAYKKEYERVMQLKNSMTIMGIPEKENDLKLPKKHFVWTDTTRGLLNTVVTTCRAAFSSVKSRKVTFDVYIVDCLTTKVLPIWPQGWMKIDNLLKEMDVKSAGKVSSTKEGSSSTSSEMKVPSASSLSIAANKNPSAANVVEKLDTKLPATPPVATTSFACSSSLTITPVSSTAAASNPLPSVQNKVTITNVDGMSGKVATASAGKVVPLSVPSLLPSGLSTVVTQQNVTIFEGFRSTTSETDSDTDSSTDCEIIENSPDAKKKASSGSLVLNTTSLLRPSKLSAGPSSAVAAAADAEMKRDMDFWRFCK